MRYTKAIFEFAFAEEWQEDVFTQQLFDLGFDTLDGAEAYIPSDMFDPQALEQLVADTEGVLLLSVEECPDENWNAAWEAEHEVERLPLGVQIVPHCAFGAGHHETTQMMINGLMNAEQLLAGAKVLDMGCGTGVLGIFAKRLGAGVVVAIDIDDHSVRNTQENAERNGVTLDARLGSVPEGEDYDLIVSNIHRNILLQHMPEYAARLRDKGQLWLSGFYEQDCQVLIDAARVCGLQLMHIEANGEWRMIQLQKI